MHMDIGKFVPAGFRGCVSVSRNGITVWERASGYADLPNRVPNRSDTIFATASGGKVYVAVGILQWIERGKLHFGDRIGDLLDFDLRGIDPEITVEQLLTHTSGMPDYFDESVTDDYEALWTDFPNYKIRSGRDLLPLFIGKPMVEPRGERFRYNNAGYVVLGILLERLSGMPFDAYLREAVFSRCGMNSTGYYELDRLPARCADHYIRDDKTGGYRTNIYSVDAKGTGAGGAYTAVGDVRLFWEALLSYRLLSKKMTDEMIRNHSGEAGCYGYGVWLEKQDDGWIPCMQGSDPGVSFLSVCDPVRELVFVAVSNYGDNVWDIWGKIRNDAETWEQVKPMHLRTIGEG